MAEDQKKTALVNSLLTANTSTSTPGNKVLIQEVTSSGSIEKENVSSSSAVTTVTEEISLMDMMLAAHQEAKQASDQIKTQERVKEAKKFGGGFKKGFLGGGGSSEKKGTKKSSPQASTPSNSSSSSSSSNQQQPSDIPTITSQQSQSSLVINDVQEAMKEESNPLLQQIKQGEWATPELMSQLQDNPILSNGLKNPKCLAALQLLQSDPKEAQKRFQNDPDVSLFIQEFSKIMSEHFFALGRQQQPFQQAPPAAASSPAIQEIGPLHAEVLAKQKSKQPQHSSQEGSITTTSYNPNYDNDDKVKQVSFPHTPYRILLIPAVGLGK